MALSHGEKNGAPIAGSHDAVIAVVADEWVRADPIRGEDRPAEEDVAKVNVEATADAEEAKERIVYIRKFDHLNYSIDSVICNLEQVAEVFCLLCPVNSAHYISLEGSVCVNEFKMSYGIFILTLY